MTTTRTATVIYQGGPLAGGQRPATASDNHTTIEATSGATGVYSATRFRRTAFGSVLPLLWHDVE
jgi:hypothetical protein